jgi:DNA primase small subunit
MTLADTARPAPMPLPPPLVYLKRCLATFYRENPPQLPERFGRREFGFVAWPSQPGPPPFVRHIGFKTRDEYQTFLRRRAPWHLYHSTAFYRDPSERRMVDKGWLGAELIFDLDADHLPDADQLDYAGQLKAVKVEFQRLLDEFVLGDLGFDEKHVRINFSGGRGYHCHVLAPDALRLEARHRRQIADYVTGKGVEERGLVRVATRRETTGRYTKEERYLVLPRLGEPGWRGRLARGVESLLRELSTLPFEEAKKRLVAFKGIGPKTAENLLDRLRDAPKDLQGNTRVDRLLSGQGDQDPLFAKVLGEEAVRREMVRLVEGETDEPVTADTKRLIRSIGSLHGKSGLQVVPLELDTLAEFDPLRDAIALPWEETDEVIAQKTARFTLNGEDFVLPENEPVPLPRAAAFFAVARRMAVPVSAQDEG